MDDLASSIVYFSSVRFILAGNACPNSLLTLKPLEALSYFHIGE